MEPMEPMGNKPTISAGKCLGVLDPPKHFPAEMVGPKKMPKKCPFIFFCFAKPVVCRLLLLLLLLLLWLLLLLLPHAMLFFLAQRSGN